METLTGLQGDGPYRKKRKVFLTLEVPCHVRGEGLLQKGLLESSSWRRSRSEDVLEVPIGGVGESETTSEQVWEETISTMLRLMIRKKKELNLRFIFRDLSPLYVPLYTSPVGLPSLVGPNPQTSEPKVRVTEESGVTIE